LTLAHGNTKPFRKTKQNKKYWQRYPSSTNIICNFPEQFSNTISAFNFRRLIEAALFAQSTI
jgi:hypothetical protein